MTKNTPSGRLLEAFFVESQERLRSMYLRLVELEKAPSRKAQEPILEVFFRDVHSLKGAARAVSSSSVERLCQGLEGVLGALKKDQVQLESGLFDLLHRSLSLVEEKLRATGDDENAAPDEATREVLAAFKALAGRKEAASRRPDPPQARAWDRRAPPAKLHEELKLSSSVRVSVEKLESLLRRSGELVRLKLMARRQLQALKEVAGRLPVGAETQDDLRSLIMESEADLLSLSVMVDGLLEEMKEVTLLPFSNVFELFPGMVREISRTQGKEVDLVLNGGDVKIDRRVLEGLKDPLIHLLRNAIDHGIPRERIGGRSNGTITVEAFQVDANQVSVVVSDDGMGMDAESLGQAALQGGKLTPSELEGLSRSQLLSLALRSGVSTSGRVTKVSGRGLGLSVVNETVEGLGGTLTVKSERGAGTVFKMLLPVTLATLRGLLVRVSDATYVVPTGEIIRVSVLPEEEVEVVNGRRAISVQGRFLPLVPLARLLQISPSGGSGSGLQPSNGSRQLRAVVLGAGDQTVALQVDAIGREEDLLAKGLGSQLGRVRHFSGATILGDGSVSLILNVRDLLGTIRSRDDSSVLTVPLSVEEEEPPGKILVVEDSFTSRTLLKDILESAGYEVTTAVDGRAAFTLLHAQAFDLVVSDVQMPRMDGLELTESIRADQNLSSLPVVLVSSLDRPEEREAGIRSGADAYVGKTSFDQANLLDVVRRYV